VIPKWTGFSRVAGDDRLPRRLLGQINVNDLSDSFGDAQ
jgi:hypothetical protein